MGDVGVDRRLLTGVVVWAADAILEYGFSLVGGAGLGVGVACGHPTGEDEEESKGEELTKASVE